MRKSKKGFLVLFAALIMLLLVPVGAEAASAKINMKTPLKYAAKGYKIIAYNKTNKTIKVYKQATNKKGYYGTLENGGAIVVNMNKVKSMTKKMTKKKLLWIPVYMHNMKSGSKITTGYVYAKYVNLTALNLKNISSNKTVNTALNYGYKYLGTQFILGGTSMTGGIDCATFTKQIYEYAGKSMPYPHTNYLQTVSYDVGLSKSKWKAGDLIFYLKNDTYGPIDHVAVYLGKSLMINASGHYGSTYPSGGICIKRVNYGARKPVRVMRLNGF